MILFINACVREKSRTKRLADSLLSMMNDEVKEIVLKDITFPIVGEEFLKYRDECVSNNNFDDSIFDLAKMFCQADKIVIAAPFWDLSFPASLKQFIEHINVLGITFSYTHEGRPLGLCKAESLYYVTTAGGRIISSDFGYGYIKELAGKFYGIENTYLIKAEGLDIEGADIEKILKEAENEIKLL